MKPREWGARQARAKGGPGVGDSKGEGTVKRGRAGLVVPEQREARGQLWVEVGRVGGEVSACCGWGEEATGGNSASSSPGWPELLRAGWRERLLPANVSLMLALKASRQLWYPDTGSRCPSSSVSLSHSLLFLLSSLFSSAFSHLLPS